MATKSRSCRPSAAADRAIRRGNAASEIRWKAADAVLLTEEPLNLEAAVRRIESPKNGAVATFLGVVRNSEGGAPIRSITYEAYQGMAERELVKIAREANERWNVDVAVRHRTGKVAAGSPSLIVACGAVHRKEAFEACRFIVDEIKARVAIWKVEYEW